MPISAHILANPVPGVYYFVGCTSNANADSAIYVVDTAIRRSRGSRSPVLKRAAMAPATVA